MILSENNNRGKYNILITNIFRGVRLKAKPAGRKTSSVFLSSEIVLSNL